MNIAAIHSLFDYNYWVNQRILETAAGLSSEQFTTPGPVSHGSLRDNLFHTMGAEWVWRLRCQGESFRNRPSAVDFPDLDSLKLLWDEEEDAMRAYLAGLTDDDLVSTIEYVNPQGEEFERPLWQILLHVINHGTQSRSEAAVLLTHFGHSPGDLDYMIFLNRG